MLYSDCINMPQGGEGLWETMHRGGVKGVGRVQTYYTYSSMREDGWRV